VARHSAPATASDLDRAAEESDGTRLSEFARKYRAAFAAYVSSAAEPGLGAAYDLGRAAVAERLSLLDLANAHHDALEAELAPAEPDRVEQVLRAAADFQRESLTTFDLARRGFLEAQETARLEQRYTGQLRALAEASLQLNATQSPQQILDLVVEHTLTILGAESTAARLYLDGGRQRLEARAGAEPLRGGTLLTTPLIGRNGLELGRVEAVASAGAQLGAREQLILDQLARIASVVIVNAELFEREHFIAQTLQRSLLPAFVPRIPGVEIATKFWPAGDGVEVGGDFYDVFRTPRDGSWVVIIGDVCGKGPEAAAVTSLARYTLRAAAREEPRPENVLATLNEAMLEQRSDRRFCTVAYGELRRAGDGLEGTIACGGHPLPLIARVDGSVETCGKPGTLLGVTEDIEVHPADVALGPGDVLLLYTDGITEAGGPQTRFGADELAAALSNNAAQRPEALVDRITEQVLAAAGGRPRDDIALVALASAPSRADA
jgi:serine phosphatase RsbU (regulator of sigma subunit)